MLAKSVGDGRVALGEDEDDATKKQFIAAGKKIGGRARELADERQSGRILIGCPWPVSRDAYSTEVLRNILSCGKDLNVDVTISIPPVRRLTLEGWESSPDDVVEVFWKVVTMSEDEFGEDTFESLVVPDAWLATVMDHGPAAWTQLEAIVPDTDEHIDYKWGFRWMRDQSKDLLKTNLDGWLPDRTVFDVQINPTILRDLIRTTLRNLGPVMFLTGAEHPPGLRALLSFRRGPSPPLTSLGSVRHIMQLLGTGLKDAFPTAAGHVTIYVTGYESFPEEHKLDPITKNDAPRVLPQYVEAHFDIELFSSVNCLSHKRYKPWTPFGHLGTHPLQMALHLAELGNLRFRQMRYCEIWILLQTTRRLVSARDWSLRMLFWCRQGKHRSLMWGIAEATIWSCLGYEVDYVECSEFSKMKCTCQKRNPRGECQFCG